MSPRRILISCGSSSRLSLRSTAPTSVALGSLLSFRVSFHSTEASFDTFRGFVDDLNREFQKARVALVPEETGGGFKLKILDYIFGRVPIAAIESALKGIPERRKPEFLVAEDLSTLVRKIIETIDDTERLNLMQTRAFELAEDVFNWDVNGRRFLEELKHRRAPSGMPPPVPSRNS